MRETNEIKIKSKYTDVTLLSLKYRILIFEHEKSEVDLNGCMYDVDESRYVKWWDWCMVVWIVCKLYFNKAVQTYTLKLTQTHKYIDTTRITGIKQLKYSEVKEKQGEFMFTME